MSWIEFAQLKQVYSCEELCADQVITLLIGDFLI